MDHCAIACVGLLVARCNSAEFLELAEEVFDQMAPAPCWWTRTIVPSMLAYSKSGSPENANCRFQVMCCQNRQVNSLSIAGQPHLAAHDMDERYGFRTFRQSAGLPRAAQS